MTRILSIQSKTMGHKVYADTLSECFQRSGQIQYDSLWSQEGRSLPTRLITRLASLRVPLLSAKERDLDLSRVRIEWSHGRMSRILAMRKLRETPYDVLYFHTQVHALGAEALMRQVPSVVSLDMTACQVAQGLRYPITVRPNIATERRVFAAAAHIVTWSDWARRSVVEDYGIAAEKVTTISPGVRLWQIAPLEVQARPMRRILFIGSDFARKGGWDLLEVFKKNFCDVAELHLVTSQPLGSPGRNVFVYNGVAAYSAEWQALLASADIFVLPSSFEAFGLVLQEAAAFGAALIGSNVGGISQMVREGENGFLIEPGSRQQLEERLRWLIEQDGLRLRLRRRSRELALEEFDAEKNARRLGELFACVKR
jgi:glycosyltransferase involved in cell wall biosynthesis